MIRHWAHAVGAFQSLEFFITVARLQDLPDGGLEVAVAGRSNAGKSSVINALANRKRLAFVSKTPGRTQQLNFFTAGPGRFLVDLPGYGYAKVEDKIRREWETLLGGYLKTRANLAGLVLIMDARRPLTPLDEQMLGWFSVTGKPVHVVLTKADKLTRQAASSALRTTREQLASRHPHASVQLFSSVTRRGRDELEGVLRQWLGMEQKKPPVKGE